MSFQLLLFLFPFTTPCAMVKREDLIFMALLLYSVVKNSHTSVLLMLQDLYRLTLRAGISLVVGRINGQLPDAPLHAMLKLALKFLFMIWVFRSMLARDLQSIVLYDQEGKFVGVRRPNSQLPIEIDGMKIVIEDAIGSSGLELKVMT